MGSNPQADASPFGVQRAATLYGSLPEQLDNADSFARQLGRMLKARKKYRLAEGELLAVPPVANRPVCILVMQAPGPANVVITALNFSRKPMREELDLSDMEGLADKKLTGNLLDIITGEQLGSLPDSGRITIELPALAAKTILVEKANLRVPDGGKR
jgi:hypothetical protein